MMSYAAMLRIKQGLLLVIENKDIQSVHIQYVNVHDLSTLLSMP